MGKILKKLGKPIFDIDYLKSVLREQDIRGNILYYFPKNWAEKAIKVIGKYEDEKWLTMNNQPGEQAVGFHGTEGGNMKSILNNEFYYSKNNLYATDININSYSDNNGKPCGVGVYFSLKKSFCDDERYSARITVQSNQGAGTVETSLVSQRMLNPKHIRITERMPDYYIVTEILRPEERGNSTNPNNTSNAPSNYIRPYRIMLKATTQSSSQINFFSIASSPKLIAYFTLYQSFGVLELPEQVKQLVFRNTQSRQKNNFF